MIWSIVKERVQVETESWFQVTWLSLGSLLYAQFFASVQLITLMSSHFSPTAAELALVNHIFAQADTQKIGILTGDVAVRIFSGAKLSPTVLGEIWNIADEDNNGFLTRKGVAVAVRLMGWAQKGEKISQALLAKCPVHARPSPAFY